MEFTNLIGKAAFLKTLGQRVYTRKVVELILEIKTLHYQRRFTIDGARQHLRSRAGIERPAPQQLLDEIRTELDQLRRLLD